MQQRDAVPVELSEQEALPLLQSGEIIGGGRVPWGSNYTFLVYIDAGPGKYLRAIYKPRDGERPLYDFPHGTLYKREYAAFVLARVLGWPDVPLTLIREGPYGIGTVQQYIDCDPNITYFNLVEDRAENLRRFAVFDVIANNADRKAGHCLLGPDGRIWSIDHGLTFHPHFKVRTVMLELWGQPVPDNLVEDLKLLLVKLDSHDDLCRQMMELIAPQEIAVLKRRIESVIKKPVLPRLDPYRNVPWPWV